MKGTTEDRQVRILIVEDETIVALDLKNTLTILGYDVVGMATSGLQAVEKAKKERPDLVLMDIILKGEMDGIQTARAIRSHLNIPIIFLTACVDEKTLQRAKVTEPFGYLIKPFEERELHSHIEIALYKHRMEKELRESEERYFLASEGANDGLWDWILTSEEIYFSSRWKSMLGYGDDQVGSSPSDWLGRIHPADKEQVKEKLEQHIRGASNHFESEYRILDASGNYRWVLCRGLAQRDKNGKAHRIAGSQTDITDRKVYNPLTGLPNQILLMDRLENSLNRVKSQNHAFAVMVLEVEGIKAIESSLGYIQADQLICQIACRIQETISVYNTAAHLGNNNFVLLLDQVNSGDQAALMASRLQKKLEEPFESGGQTVYVTVYVGITLSNNDYACPDELIRDASAALNRAKNNGKDHFEIFDRHMLTSAVAHLRLETQFRKALERREFKVYYQPIVSLTTGAIVGFEALLRWPRQNGMLYPGDFLNIAEATDMLVDLENWVLRESCKQVAQWQQPGRDPLMLNVNLCAKHYAIPDLAEDLGDILQSSGLDPHLLGLEITESAIMENTDTVTRTLSQIKKLGIQFHMDDFGTGYSSLSYLHRFPIDSLKIDRSFVGSLGLNNEILKIVQAIVSLGRNLDKKLIAEGIENITQLRTLQTFKCEFGQGYYFAKPLDPNEIEFLISRPSPWFMAFDDHDHADIVPRAVEA